MLIQTPGGNQKPCINLSKIKKILTSHINQNVLELELSNISQKE